MRKRRPILRPVVVETLAVVAVLVLAANHLASVWVTRLDAEQYYQAGNSYISGRLWANAADEFRKAIRLKPDYADAHSALGDTYGWLGRRDEMRNELAEYTRLKGGSADVHVDLAYSYLLQEMYEDAVREAKEAIRLQPNNVHAHFWLGFSYDQLGKRREALDEYEVLKRIDKSKAENLREWMDDPNFHTDHRQSN